MWTYRVIHREFTMPNGDPEHRYAIHEHYEGTETFGEDGAITEDPCHPEGETLVKLRSDLHRMINATGKPVLDWSDFCDKGEE